MELEDIVSKYPPRQIMLIPLAIIVIALIILGATYLSTGSPVKLGVEFTGGTLVTVPAVESEDAIKEKFAAYPLLEVRDIGNRYLLQFGPMDDAEYVELAKQINSQYEDAEIRYMGPIYSQALQQEALRYIPLSFILMAIVVFAVFREPIVSAIVVLCALADILIAAASMTVVGISLSLGTVAALLMLIGYSVDTDILLSMRVLKRKGTVEEKAMGAMGTGLMMTGTTIVAVLSLFMVSNVLYLVVPSFHQNGNHCRYIHGAALRSDCRHVQHLDHQRSGSEMVYEQKWQGQEAEKMSFSEDASKDPRVVLYSRCSHHSADTDITPLPSIIGRQSGLKYGLDLEGGSWLQLQLQGAVVQLDADPEGILEEQFNATSVEKHGDSYIIIVPGTVSATLPDDLGYPGAKCGEG